MPFVTDGQRFRIIAAAAAHFAHHVNVGKKIHFDAAQAVALAGFAAPAFHVEAEAAGTVAAFARFRKHGEEIADRREDAGVSGGIRPRGAANRGLIDFDNFVDLLGADNFAVRGGSFRRAVKLLRQRAIENVVDESGLAGTRNACDDGEQSKRQRNVHILQIIRARAKNLDGFAVGAAALFGDGDFCRAAQVLTGEGGSGGFDLRRFALGDEVAAGVAGAGAKVDDEISAADGVFVVFDDEDGVAEIAKMFEGAEQARIVAGVEADAGLIENVENAAKARADLRGESNTLRFAAGKSGGGAIQAEIAEADGEQELDSFGNFFQRTRGDFFLAFGELRKNFVDGEARGAERERGEIGDGEAAELDRERFGAQALAVADGALRRGHVLRDPLAIGIGVGLFEISFEEFQYARETETFIAFGFFSRRAIFARCAPIRWRVAVQKHVLDARGEFFKRRFEIKAVGVSAEFERALEDRRAGARTKAAVEEWASPVRDDFGWIEIVFRAETVARRARAVGRIEAERARLELRNGDAAIGAGELFGKSVLFAAGDGLFEARGDARLDEQAVNDDFDGVVLALVDDRKFIKLVKLAVDAHTDVPVLREFLKFFSKSALPSTDDGRENHDAVVRLADFTVQDGLDNLLAGLACDGLAAVGAMRDANGRVDHAEIIVNFSDGADGGARRARGRFLFDGDRG